MEVPKYNRDKYYRIMDCTQSNYANQLKRISRDSNRADSILIYYSLAIIIYSLSDILYPSRFDERWTAYSSIIMSIIVLIYSIINSKAHYAERINSLQIALNEVKRLKREVGALPKKCQKTGDHQQNPLEEVTTLHQPNLQSKVIQKLGGLHIRQKEGADETKDINFNCTLKLNELKEEYNRLVNSVEIRDDLDFYNTILSLCKKYKLSPWTGKNLQKSLPTEEEQIIIEEIQGYISENNPPLQCFHTWLRRIWHALLYVVPVGVFLINLYIAGSIPFFQK